MGRRTWLSFSNEPRMIEVKGSVSTDTEITVPSDWSLIPSGLTAGDKFRLLFLTNAGHSPTSTRHRGLQHLRPGPGRRRPRRHPMDYSSWFRVVGSTADTDARDNTETTSSDTAAAIYWLERRQGGRRLRRLLRPVLGQRDQPQGSRRPIISLPAKNVWTGSTKRRNRRRLAAPAGLYRNALGAHRSVRVGRHTK